MKRSDIVSIILVASVGMIATFFLGQAVLGDPNEKSVSYKVVQEITDDLQMPDEEVFNADAVNPTVEVYVGDCEDVDQNGMIDKAELMACGKVAAESNEDGANAESTEGENAEAGGTTRDTATEGE